MSDHFSGGPSQDDAALAPDLAQLDELLLAEGQRWRRNEPSTARLERHVQALAQPGASSTRNEEYMLTERNQAPDTTTPQPVTRHAPPRWRGPLAVVATVLLVAMAATVFTFLSGRSTGTWYGQRATKATPTPGFTRITAIQPPNTFLPMPANAYLSGLSFSSAHDGWAVGGIRIPDYAGQNFSAQRGVLVHYHDGVWTAASDSFPGISLDSVSMVSATDGWAVGQVDAQAVVTKPADWYTGAVLLHFSGDGAGSVTGGHWKEVSAPALATLYPTTIRMFSPDSGYIIGAVDISPTTPGSMDQPGSVTQHAAVGVYKNGAWTLITTPFEAFTSQVVMVSAGEGWAVTNENGEGAVYHYLNGVWAKALAFPGSADSISSASAMDVWALGRSLCVATPKARCPNSYIPVIYHFNGSGWSRVKSPNVVDVSQNNLIQPAIFDEATNGVWLPLVSQDSSQPPSQRPYTTLMWVYGMNGKDTWLPISQPVKGGAVFTLTADGNGGLWAIAQTDTPFGITILYTQGTDWTVYGHS